MENPVTLDLSGWDLCALELALRRLQDEWESRGDAIGNLPELRSKIAAAIAERF